MRAEGEGFNIFLYTVEVSVEETSTVSTVHSLLCVFHALFLWLLYAFWLQVNAGKHGCGIFSFF